MTTTPPGSKHFESAATGGAAPEGEYRAVSSAAVLTLLASPVAAVSLVGPQWWWVGAAVAAANVWTLARIVRSDGELIGRKASIVGTAIGFFCLGAGCSTTVVRQTWLGPEAATWADEWFKLMAAGRPELAYQYHLSPLERQPFDDRLWEYYRTRPVLSTGLKKFVQQQPARALLALGKQAEVRFCGTERYLRGELADHRRGDLFVRVYAVSFPRDGAKQTFLMRVFVARVLLDPQLGQSAWQVLGVASGLSEHI